MKSLLVTSNCQTPGYVSVLRTMLPGWTIDGVTLHAMANPEGRENLHEQLKSVDVWVTSANSQQMMGFEDVGAQTIFVPNPRFRAFHPDILLFHSAIDGKVVNGPLDSQYHSRIVAGCYRLGFDVDTTVALFNEDAFEQFGFLSVWDQEIKALTEIVRATDIDPRTLLPALFRLGIFMHSHNHPTIGVIAAVCRQLATRLGVPGSIDISVVPDPLRSAPGWPVYPPIARRFGESGSYVWRRTAGRFVSSVREFTERSFEYYDAIDLASVMPERALPPETYDALREAA